MPFKPTPIIDTFVIPIAGWEFSDVRVNSDADQAETWRLWRKNLMTDWANLLPGAETFPVVCSENATRFRLEYELYMQAKANEPDLTFSEFQTRPESVVDDQQQRPDRHQVMWTVRESGVVIGAFLYQNIEAIRDEPGVFQVRGYGLPGLPPFPPLNRTRTWGRLMKWLLKNNVTARGGQIVFDIKEFWFHHNYPPYWIPTGANQLASFWNEFDDPDFDFVMNENDTRFRKRVIRRV